MMVLAPAPATIESTSPVNPCIHQLFEDQVERTPDALAMVDGLRRYSFRELNTMSDRLASFLIEKGLRPGGVVAICMSRSVDFAVAVLATLKARGCFLPIDHTYPEARISLMLDDSRAWVVLTQSALIASRRVLSDRGTCIEKCDGASSLNIDAISTNEGVGSDACYLIYTSGSTGTPRGVIGGHSAIVNRFEWMWETYPFHPGEVCCFKTSIGFIDSLWELLGPLLRGACVTVASDETRDSPDLLIRFLEDASVTRLVLVPSQLRFLLEAIGIDKGRLSALRICASSGEELPPELVFRFRELVPSCVLLNLYGSSEVAADVTAYDTSHLLEKTRRVPIGRPIKNTQVETVDEHLKAVHDGSPGELWISGANLAIGYHNKPELTNEKFIERVNTHGVSTRFYRTGDLARWLADGNLEWLGRIDQQVKIHGIRIEVEEIEFHLRRHYGVDDAAVLAEKANIGLRLTAYITPSSSQVPSPSVLRAFLEERLPRFMVPAKFVFVPHFPFTRSGKVDRRKLPEAVPLSTVSSPPSDAPCGPLENTVATIWKRVLAVTEVGREDSFLALGGSSLAAVLAAFEGGRVGLPLTVKLLLEESPLREVCRTLKQTAPKIEQGLVVGRVRCLPQQRQLFERHLPAERSHFAVCAQVELQRRVEPGALVQAVTLLVGHHDALRTRFEFSGSEWVQVFAPRETAPIVSVHSVPDVSQEAREAFLTRLAADLAAGLCIHHGPLLRMALIEPATAGHQRLLVTVSHFVTDDISLLMFLQDLEQVLRSCEKGEAIILPTKTASVREYSLALHRAEYRHKIEYGPRFLALAQLVKAQPAVPRRRATMIKERVRLEGEFVARLLRDFRTVYSVPFLETVLAALCVAKRQIDGVQIIGARVVKHNRATEFDGMDLSRTYGLIRLHVPLVLNLTGVETPEDALKVVRASYEEQQGLGEAFNTLAFPSADGEPCNEVRRLYDQAHFHLNFTIPYVFDPAVGLFENLPPPSIPDPEIAGDETIRIYINCDPAVPLELCWYYFEDVHDKAMIAGLVECFGTHFHALAAIP